MSTLNISEEITDAQKTSIKSNIDDIKGILTFLINLTPEKRGKLRKMKAKRISYVNDVLTGVKANPDVIPKDLDVPEYEKDVKLYNDLVEVMGWLITLFEGLEDTTMEVGSESMKAADTGYSYLKIGAKKSSKQALTLTVQKIADQLKQRTKTNLIQQA